MPPIETAYRRQTALLWRWLRVDGDNEPIVDAPEEITVRWKWGQTQMAGPQGTPVGVDATVIVAEDIVIGSHMWEGTLDEWLGHSGSGSGSAGDYTFLMEVIASNFTPDLKNRNTRRTLGLRYFRDTPAQEG